MLKRLFLIGLFTGAGQVFAILVLKFIAQKTSSDQLGILGQLDSLFFFILNFIALGLQSTAMRNIAVTKDWKSGYISTQSARFMLGLCLIAGALLSFNNPVYIIFLISPFLALSGDYALYALGYPVTGAIIAFIRTVVPYGLIMMLPGTDPMWMIFIFLSGLAIAYAGTNYYISQFLGVPFVVMPEWRNLLLYFYSLSLGLVNMSLYFIGIGLLLIVPYFYPETIVAASFVGLKFYLIYKGVLRIIHQAFVKDMVRDDICLRVDQLSIIGGLTFAGAVLIFPTSFITLFFGSLFTEYSAFFIILGIAALVYSFVLSMGTRIMLDKRDKIYTLISAAAALVSIITVIVFSYFFQTAKSVSFSILLGEISFMIGLLFIMNKKDLILERSVFLAKSMVFLLFPLMCRYLFSDSTLWFLIGMGSFTTLLVFFHRHKFSTLSVG